MATQYTDTFKQETLRYIQDNPHKTRQQIADELGIAYGTLKGWCSTYKETGVLSQTLSTPPTTKELEQQIKKLKRQLELAHQDIDILKKFGVYMAKLQK
jgi:transposase-like protein